MPKDDFTDLVLFLARQVTNTMDVRDDEVIHILADINETLELIDSVILSKGTATIIWDQFTWGLATWA